MIQSLLVAGGGGIIAIVVAFLFGKRKGRRIAEDKQLTEGVEDVLKTQERTNERASHRASVIREWLQEHGTRDEVLRSSEADTSNKS